MSHGWISGETKEEIRRRTDIVALVSTHASLKKSGRYYKGLCPFHQEKTPSFLVDPERGLFHCFGCGAGGDIFDFAMRSANLTFMEAAQELGRQAGVEIETSPDAAQRASEKEQILRALAGRFARGRLSLGALAILAVFSAAWVQPVRVTIVGEPGRYELRVSDRPFYVKGVSFPLNEDPLHFDEHLTPDRLRFHFHRIRGMGANTVRRYHDSPDTQLILDEASRANLMVLLGIWLDHDVDYAYDAQRLQVYRDRVRDWVLRYRGHPALLMWVLGNETWGLLKKEFQDTRDLWPRRKAYYLFVNELARLVKSLDPNHPVMTVDEHAPDLFETHPRGFLGIETSMGMLRDLAPAVDVFGINSYFPQDISVLHRTVLRTRIGRPYLVSEFGPPAYWGVHWTWDDLGLPVEPTDLVKSLSYAANWKYHVEAHRGWNLGGNAFVWKDKKEGSFTWFGLTDSQDRLKPAYWSLREAWTGQRQPPNRPVVVGLEINKRWMRPEESFVVRTRLLPHLDPEGFRYTYVVGPAAMTHLAAQFTTELPRVSIQAPGTSDVYRVYVYVTTRDDRWVSTGSTTFGVYLPAVKP
ncbi:MAG: CHC2 zinc finger domain-containing protein [bacterium]|nr:CHC2 zinc finger domain-containing protein [bacterium]